MEDNKFYINCPYEEKDLAKALGAKWDIEEKKWFVPNGVDRNSFNRWITNDNDKKKSPHLKPVK